MQQIPCVGKFNNNKETQGTATVTNPLTLWKELQVHATGKLGAKDFTMEDEEMILDENVARMSAYLISTYKPALTTLHLACTDHYEHEQGRDGFLVRKAVAGADRALGTITEALKRAGIYENTTVIVTGDHGFVNISRNFSPNVLLAHNGLMDNIKTGDWKARFHSSGGSAFLHLKDPKDSKTAQKVQALLKALPAAQQQLFRTICRRDGKRRMRVCSNCWAYRWKTQMGKYRQA